MGVGYHGLCAIAWSYKPSKNTVMRMHRQRPGANVKGDVHTQASGEKLPVYVSVTSRKPMSAQLLLKLLYSTLP